MNATALTVRRTREGYEVRCAFSYEGKAPTSAKRRAAALVMLRDVLRATEKGEVKDGGFQVSDKERRGVGTVLVDGGKR